MRNDKDEKKGKNGEGQFDFTEKMIISFLILQKLIKTL